MLHRGEILAVEVPGAFWQWAGRWQESWKPALCPLGSISQFERESSVGFPPRQQPKQSRSLCPGSLIDDQFSLQFLHGP